MLKSVIKIAKSQRQEIMPGRAINAPLPSSEIEESKLSPFVLLHHFGPFEVNYLNRFAFEPHPHRGFEAVTFLFEGELQHRDSAGGKGSLASGDVQWMTAGSGILHEESQPKEFLEKGGIVHGIQLWINLPKKFKMTDPKYQDIRNKNIPVISSSGAIERVIAGSYKDLTGPAVTFTPIIAVHGKISKGSNLICSIPEKHNSCIYVTSGKIGIGGHQASVSDLALLSESGKDIELTSLEDSEFLLLAGEPINEPAVQYGPFVMNTMGEIKQAFLDYREGKFGVLN